jgi:hypothetical protein
MDPAYLFDHPEEIRGQQGLGAIAERTVGLAVGLHQQAIRACGHGGARRG